MMTLDVNASGVNQSDCRCLKKSVFTSSPLESNYLLRMREGTIARGVLDDKVGEVQRRGRRRRRGGRRRGRELGLAAHL
jgi:hypothetical protein